MKIAIFCGGPSSEHEVSLNSAQTIAQYIDTEKYDVFFFFISKDRASSLFKSTATPDFSAHPKKSLLEGLQEIKKQNMFALLAGIHGEFVEDGQLQNLLDYFEIPYSGSSSKASSLCMDKYHSMQIVSQLDEILIPKTILTKSPIQSDISYPQIVKPNSLGSSVGLYIVHSYKEQKDAIKAIHATHHQREILIQELIEGIEISCGCLQKNNGEFITLPPIEIIPITSETFDYTAKYEIGGSKEITPPQSLSPSLSQKISDLTCKIHEILGCSTYSRSDFRIMKDKIYYLETNTLPGMTKTSLLPQEAQAAGISFPKLIDFLIQNPQ